MSDVEHQLFAIMKRSHGEYGDYKKSVNAILARYDVTPKSTVSPKQLGEMVAESYDDGRPTFEEQGENMIDQLANAGMMIVFIGETKR